ncbi:MAG: hypothetical protein IIA00_10225 [Proteobacteria bacterium]|nr:hypothetical protein [Pseudomonadota bacterium]
MARPRSPNYPAISLPEAIERLHKLFKRAQRQTITREQAAEAMGYDGLHGGSLGALSALLKFGLLEKGANGVRVSDRGIAIIAPEDDEERNLAFADAAFSPSLFKELTERFLGGMPSDEKLRSYLIRKNFSSSALDRVIRSYRETMELVSDEGPGYTFDPTIIQSVGTERETDMAGGVGASQFRPQAPPSVLTASVLRVSFTDDRLEVTAGLIDAEAVDRLIKVLEANKPLLPQKADIAELQAEPEPWQVRRGAFVAKASDHNAHVERMELHRVAVMDAVRKGKPVPDEVRADYPDVTD